MAYTTSTLTGTYEAQIGGTAAEGYVEIIPSVKVIKDTAGNVILTGRRKITLDVTGSFTTDLPATDDASLNPTGFGYTIVAKLRHQHLPAVSFYAPGGVTQDVEELTPVDPATFTPDATYVQTVDLEPYALTVDTEPAGTVAALDATLATVAKSGTYGDLTGHPVIPSTPGEVGAEPVGLSTATQDGLSATYARRSRGIPAARGAVCFTWDDGFASHDTIRQMADERDQRHTFGITTGLLNQANRMTDAQVLAAFQAGHEISSHATQHVTGISDLSLANRVIDYDDSKTYLEGLIGAGNVRTFTYTFGSHKRNATTDKELYLRYDRLLNTGSNSGDSGSPFLYRRDEMVPGATPFLIGRFPWTSLNHSRVLEVIRLAQHSPIIVNFYAHDPDSTDNPTMAQVTEAMDLCESLGVDCLTTEEAFPSQQILTDPGFEDTTLSAWHTAKSGAGTFETVAEAPAAGLTGSRSLHIVQSDASGSGFAYVAQQVPVTPGASYTLSFKYRSNTSGISFTRPRARTRDYVGNIITQNQANLTNVQATWADGSLVFTADATAVSVSLEFIININTGEAWFDHVHFGPTRLGVFG